MRSKGRGVRGHKRGLQMVFYLLRCSGIVTVASQFLQTVDDNRDIWPVKNQSTMSNDCFLRTCSQRTTEPRL